jgi:peptidoglycan/LPS O-acetylase OafA/YrhL
VSPAYRADIDGLRAIAVLAVVLFHAGFSSFGGGYVGVDVFFVISGFLITTIILNDLEANRFSIKRFYERRVRRIFPALFVVIASCILAGALIFSPADLRSLGDSVTATTLFASNMLFWVQTGYFATPGEHKPLLHTWSLAIEEQFYVAFPLLFWAAYRYSRLRGVTWVSVVAIASFLASLVAVRLAPDAAFYWVVTRAWELLAGSLLALRVVPAMRSDALRNLAAALGIGCIVISISTYSHTTPFPGAAALLPTLGTALIIHSGAGGSSVVHRFLSTRPLVFVGLISYSLYLWHWPMIVFLRYVVIHELDLAHKLAVITAAGALSIVTWHWVEKPFRSAASPVAPRGILRLAGAVMALGIAVGLAIRIGDGLPWRFDPTVLPPALANESVGGKWIECRARTGRPQQFGEPCKLGVADVVPSFMLWGDSHALALAEAVDVSARREGAQGTLATMTACPPLLGVERLNRERCARFNDGVLRYLAAHPELQTVILAARWAISAEGTRYKNESGNEGNVTLTDLYAEVVPGIGRDGQNHRPFQVGLERTVKELLTLNRRTVIVSPVPEVGYDVPNVVIVARRTNRDVDAIIAPTLTEYTARNRVVFDTLERLRRLPNVWIVDPAKILCRGGRCRITDRDNVLYLDDDHLSSYGARYVSPVFDEVLSRDP